MKKLFMGLFCLATSVSASDSQHWERDLSAQQLVMTMTLMVLPVNAEPVKDKSQHEQQEQKANHRAKDHAKVPYRKTHKDKSQGQSHSRFTGR